MAQPLFLEIFAGQGELSRAMRQRGWIAIEWDILWGPSWDLTRPGPARTLRGWLISRLFDAVHLGTPCSSFSRARDRAGVRAPGSAGWPGALRSAAAPWGLAAVQHRDDLAALRLGNTLARFSIGIWRLCKRLVIPASLENPATSRLWDLPELVAAGRWEDSHEVVTHYCQDGMPWKKATRFRGLFMDLSAVPRRCSGPRGLCSRTGRPHQALEGRSPAGPLWTKVAEPYPRPLSNRLAAALHSATVALNVKCVESILLQ